MYRDMRWTSPRLPLHTLPWLHGFPKEGPDPIQLSRSDAAEVQSCDKKSSYTLRRPTRLHVAISCKALGSLGKPWMAQPLLGSDSPCLRSGGVHQMEGQAFAHNHGLKHLLGGGSSRTEFLQRLYVNKKVNLNQKSLQQTSPKVSDFTNFHYAFRDGENRCKVHRERELGKVFFPHHRYNKIKIKMWGAPVSAAHTGHAMRSSMCRPVSLWWHCWAIQ